MKSEKDRERVNESFLAILIFNAIIFLCAVDKIMTKPNSSFRCTHLCDESCHVPIDAKLGLTKEIIIEAIKHLNKGKSGSSKHAIEIWVREKYALEKAACNKGVLAALRENKKNNNIWRVKGCGASAVYAIIEYKTEKAIAAAA